MALADPIAQPGHLGDVVEQPVEDAQEHAGLGVGHEVGQAQAAVEVGGAAVERGDGVGHVVVLEELNDELAELLVPRGLGEEQVAGGVHVRTVLAVGLALADGVQAQGDGRRDDRILHQQLRFRLARLPGRDVVFEVLDGAVKVVELALPQLGLGVQSGQVGAGEAHERMHQAAVLGGHGQQDLLKGVGVIVDQGEHATEAVDEVVQEPSVDVGLDAVDQEGEGAGDDAGVSHG